MGHVTWVTLKSPLFYPQALGVYIQGKNLLEPSLRKKDSLRHRPQICKTLRHTFRNHFYGSLKCIFLSERCGMQVPHGTQAGLETCRGPWPLTMWMLRTKHRLSWWQKNLYPWAIFTVLFFEIKSHVGQVGLNFLHTSPCLIYMVLGSELGAVYMLGRLSVDFEYRRGKEGCAAK